MKKDSLIDYMGQISDDFIEHAQIAKRNSHPVLLRSIAVAAACILLSVCTAIPIIHYLNSDISSNHINEKPSNKALEINGFVISGDTLIDYNGEDKELSIPDEVETISAQAFQNCSSALTITSLEAKSLKVEKGALDPLINLTSVSLTGTTDEELSKAVNLAINSTVEELISMGIGLEYEYTENGGTPVYKVTNTDGIRLIFGDGDYRNPLSGSAKVQRIIITDSKLKFGNGLFVGMSSYDAKALNLEWHDIYWTTDSMLYYTVIKEEGLKYTLAWNMDENVFNQWILQLTPDDTCYYASPEKYSKPYDTDSIGDLNRIIIEKE